VSVMTMAVPIAMMMMPVAMTIAMAIMSPAATTTALIVIIIPAGRTGRVAAQRKTASGGLSE
jgi:hypothetical protein